MGAAGDRPDDFRRHLQGYELGLLTLGIALTFALLALPRGSVPLTLPLPVIDRREVRQSAELELALVHWAEHSGLPFEVRAVGESVRHFGHSTQRGIDTFHDRQDIHERVQRVEAKGQAPLLLLLRAVQTEYFLAALRRFEQSGKPDNDLDELGADFIDHGRRSGWFDPKGRCLADEGTRRVLFHLHFAELIERRSKFPFAPSLTELRLYYRFLLLHPEPNPGLPSEVADDTARLGVVSALAQNDPDYPQLFAKGTLLYRLGDSQAAASAFRRQLALRESGPYALLARNYLIRALQDVPTE